jgi:hypothetical protein
VRTVSFSTTLPCTAERKPLPPSAISATGTQSPPLPTEIGAVFAIRPAETGADEEVLPSAALELLRRRCDAAAGPSYRTATNENATTNAHAAACARDKRCDSEGMPATTWARHMKMRQRAMEAAAKVAMRLVVEAGGGAEGCDDNDDDDNVDSLGLLWM